MAMWLYRALKVVIYKDSNSFRQFVFNELAARTLSISLVINVYKFMPSPIKTLMILIYGAKSYLFTGRVKGNSPILYSVQYKNEKRKMKLIKDSVPDLAMEGLNSNLFNLLDPKSFLKFLGLILDGRVLRILARVSKKYDFLVACRSSSTLFYYLKITQMPLSPRVKYSLVSSDTNPYALGLSFALKAKGRESIYITHGHLPEDPPRDYFDYSLFDGEAVVDVYRRSGKIAGEYFLIGAEGVYNKLDLSGFQKENPVIGVFLSLVTDWNELIHLLEKIKLKFNPPHILVRLHPNEIIRDHKGVKKLSEIPYVKISKAESVAVDDMREVDIVVAGNSSVHLTALKFGKPTLYFKGVDAVPHDFYLFVEKAVVPYFSDLNSYDSNKVLEFYSHDWRVRFEYFDKSYNESEKRPDFSQEEIAKAFKEIMT